MSVTNLIKHAKMCGEIERHWKVNEKSLIRDHRRADRRDLDELRIEKYESFDTERDGKAESSTESEISDWDGSTSEEEMIDEMSGVSARDESFTEGSPGNNYSFRGSPG